MLTCKKAREILQPGEDVYTLSAAGGGVAPAKVLEICDGWLETDAGILDLDDHGRTWWLTNVVARRKYDARR